MSHYVVTITPKGRDESETDTKPRLVVHVEVVDGEAHVVEFSAWAPAGTDLASGDLPMVDLKRLAHVFGRVADRDAPKPVPAAAPTAAPAATASRRPAAGSSAPAPKRARSRSESGIGKARAYRRMPEPEALAQVYSEIGSIAGVAKHYGVPAHTAQGWIGRLRRLGVLSDSGS